jgi:4,5-dihydroxyphthalate decarboxylase
MADSFSLSVAIGRYDRTQALLDGRVQIEAADAKFESPPFETLFERAYDHEAYDVAELSFSNFIYLTSIGRCPYVGLPIFPSKMFRHSAIFIRTDRNIQKPADLAGRLVGVREYSMTAAMTARGVLADEYGVPSSNIRWRYGPAEANDSKPVIRMLPKGFDIAPLGNDDNLSNALAEGAIDALIAYKPPSCFKHQAQNIARLFPEHEKQEADYFARTRIFPLMHLIGVRRSLMQERSSVTRSRLLSKSHFTNCLVIRRSPLAIRGLPLKPLVFKGSLATIPGPTASMPIARRWTPLSAGRFRKE